MNHPTKWWVPFVLPPLRLLRYLLSGLYAVTFAPVDAYAARKREARFATDVNLAFTAVLGKDTFRVIDNYDTLFPPGFDYAYTTIAFPNFFVRLLRGRGEFDALIAPKFAQSDWHDASLVFSAIDGDTELRRKDFGDVWDVARSLQAHLSALMEISTPERFTELKHRLDREVYAYERFANRQWETEINARLYGPDKFP
jgi:hypothetical protein